MEKIPFIGELTEKVAIYRIDTVMNELREPIPTKVKVIETRAKMDSEVGREETDEKVNHVVNAAFTIRKRSGVRINKEMTLECDDVKYNIIHVSKIQRSHLKIHCTAYE